MLHKTLSVEVVTISEVLTQVLYAWLIKSDRCKVEFLKVDFVMVEFLKVKGDLVKGDCDQQNVVCLPRAGTYV